MGDTSELGNGLALVLQHVAGIINQANSNHQVLLAQIDQAMQTAVVLSSFLSPHVDQETEPQEAPNCRGMPQDSSSLSSHLLAQRHNQTEAAKQAGDQDNSSHKDGSSSPSSRVSTSSLPPPRVYSDITLDEQPSELFIPPSLVTFQAPESNMDTNTYQKQRTSHRSQRQNQQCAPHHSKGQLPKRHSHQRFALAREQQERQHSLDSSEFNAVVPDSASNSASFQSPPSEHLSNSNLNSPTPSMDRLSNSSRNSGSSRIKDLNDMKKAYLLRMHGIQTEGSASASSSSQALENRRVRAARLSAGHRRPMPQMPALSSPDLPGMPHQPAQAEGPRDEEANMESSAATAQEQEDGDMFEKDSAGSIASLEDISRQEEEEVAHLSTNKSASVSLMPFRQSKMDAMRSSLESQLVEKMGADPVLVNMQRVPYTGQVFFALCRSPRILLHLFGIAPWGAGLLSKAYFTLAPFLLAFCFGLSMNQVVQQRLTVVEAISTESHTLGCLLAFLSFRWHGAHKSVGSAGSLLDQHATIGGFSLEWHWKSFQEWLVILLGVMGMLMAKLGFILDPECRPSSAEAYGHSQMVRDLTSLVLSTGYFAAIMYCQVLVSSGLSVAVDTSCAELTNEKNLAHALSKWELLQAVLRQAAKSTEGCFCALGLTVVMDFVCTALQVMQGHASMMDVGHNDGCFALWYGWVVPRWMLMLYVFHKAAYVTDLCSQVPSLINSWSFCTDRQQRNDRQHAVQYIIHSEAGYYIGGVRITSQLKMKITYLICVVIFTVVSQKSFMNAS